MLRDTYEGGGMWAGKLWRGYCFFSPLCKALNPHTSMLTALLVTPLLGALVLLPMDDETAVGRAQVKRVALAVSMVAFALSIAVWATYDASTPGYQFVQSYTTLGFCHLHVGVDALSLYYVVLTALLMPICLLASWENVQSRLKAYFTALLVVETLLLTVFTVLDLLLFYVFFEAALVPLFLIVGIWGGSATRVRAALLLFLYTLAGSLFMLLAIVVIADHVGTTDFTLVTLSDFSYQGQRLLWLGFFVAFAVKTPLVPFHMWLPRAHAEAPLAGSMLLAGVVLKVASYGMLRILLPMLPDATQYFSPLVQAVAVVTIIYSALAALRQVDTKALVAYSSISHMGVIVLGIFSNTVIGIEGAYLLSLAHGLVSPALFMLVGGVLYDRFHTRVLRYYRGLVVYMPVFATLFFITACANMAVPLSLNWAGEFMALAGAFQRSPVTAVMASTGIVLSACYTIWLWSRMVGGSWSAYLEYTVDVTRREFMVLLPLLALTVLLGILPGVILADLHANVTLLLYTYSPTSQPS